MVRPVLCIPVLNRPDLFKKCVRSIDYDVDVLVIDNSEDSFAAEIALDAYADGKFDAFFVTEPPTNLGVAASWNLAIKTHPEDPFWLFANADVEFGKGDIAAVIAEMEGARWVGVNGDWRLMGLTAETVDRIGFFDENFHPVYCEDADYERRCHLAGIPISYIDGKTSHVGSICYRGDPRNERNNARTYPQNVAYYIEKWGGPPRRGEVYSTPWNRGGRLSEWVLQRERLAAQRWT